MTLRIFPIASLQGTMRPPSDKSLTHRGYMLAAIASTPSIVKNPLRAEDTEATLRCLCQMGLRPEWSSADQVTLTPAPRWSTPASPLDCGNSGTTIRLLSGLVASRPIQAVLTGDESLNRRPMGRIAQPLRLMGAEIEGDTPPLTINGTEEAKAIRYETPVASAQIKSCVLLAGLRAQGETVVLEPTLSRDHTERMLRAMGASVISMGGQAVATQKAMSEIKGHEVRLTPTENLNGFELNVPGDISSAAFFMVAAAILPEGFARMEELSINPTRTGILDVFEEAGVRVSLENVREEMGEPVADVEVRSTREDLSPFSISGPIVPRLIDEIPVLCVLATQCSGTSHIRDAAELRVKESDRIELIADGLREMGAVVETHPDGLSITGPVNLKATTVDSRGDHRIAMAFAIAGLIADGTTVIEGSECIATSFPSFEKELERLSIV